MAVPLCLSDRMPHQKAPDAAFTAIGRNRQGAQQEGLPRRTGADAPEPERADEALASTSHEGEARFRQAALAQALSGLGGTTLAEGIVKERLAAGDIKGGFVTNCDHGMALRAPDGALQGRGSWRHQLPQTGEVAGSDVVGLQRREAVE